MCHKDALRIVTELFALFEALFLPLNLVLWVNDFAIYRTPYVHLRSPFSMEVANSITCTNRSKSVIASLDILGF